MMWTYSSQFALHPTVTFAFSVEAPPAVDPLAMRSYGEESLSLGLGPTYRQQLKVSLFLRDLPSLQPTLSIDLSKVLKRS